MYTKLNDIRLAATRFRENNFYELKGCGRVIISVWRQNPNHTGDWHIDFAHPDYPVK